MCIKHFNASGLQASQEVANTAERKHDPAGAAAAAGSTYMRNAEGRYKCPHCAADFARRDGVTRHVEKACTTLPSEKAERRSSLVPGEYVRTSQGRYKCPQCDVDFSRPRSVTEHLAKSCRKKPWSRNSLYKYNARGKYGCPHCDAEFSRLYNVAAHVETRCPTLFPAKLKAPTKKGKALPKESAIIMPLKENQELNPATAAALDTTTAAAAAAAVNVAAAARTFPYLQQQALQLNTLQ